MQPFPPVRDLVTDVSWNFRVKKQIKPFKPRKPEHSDGTWQCRRRTSIASRNFASASNASSARTCVMCLRDHQMNDKFIGPRYFVYTAALEMHPLDTEDRIPELKQRTGSATATSPSAARRSARRTFTSLTTPSFR